MLTVQEISLFAPTALVLVLTPRPDMLAWLDAK
jgi:hypothetical protein